MEILVQKKKHTENKIVEKYQHCAIFGRKRIPASIELRPENCYGVCVCEQSRREDEQQSEEAWQKAACILGNLGLWTARTRPKQPIVVCVVVWRGSVSLFVSLSPEPDPSGPELEGLTRVGAGSSVRTALAVPSFVPPSMPWAHLHLCGRNACAPACFHTLHHRSRGCTAASSRSAVGFFFSDRLVEKNMDPAHKSLLSVHFARWGVPTKIKPGGGKATLQNHLMRGHLLSQHRRTRATHRALFFFLLKAVRSTLGPLCVSHLRKK